VNRRSVQVLSNTHAWTSIERAAVVAVLATAMGALFVITFSLALADPVPHNIEAALVGSPTRNPGATDALEAVADGKVTLKPYVSASAALHALDEQQLYAALDALIDKVWLSRKGITSA
jgi:hypothetical protein